VDDKINGAVVDATRNVFKTMLKCEVHAEEPRVKGPNDNQYDMTGIVAITGSSEGIVALRVSREIAVQAGEALIGEPPESEEEITDIVAELTNMVAGNTKANLGQSGTSISIPTVIMGRQSISCGSSRTPVVIPIQSDWGPFSVEITVNVK
jgi:chemotaxis protein CheX